MRQSQPTAQAEGLERRNVATSIPVLIPSQGMKGLEQIVRVFDLGFRLLACFAQPGIFGVNRF